MSRSFAATCALVVVFFLQGGGEREQPDGPDGAKPPEKQHREGKPPLQLLEIIEEVKTRLHTGRKSGPETTITGWDIRKDSG